MSSGVAVGMGAYAYVAILLHSAARLCSCGANGMGGLQSGVEVFGIRD